MVAIEKIEGQRILRLFKELQKEATLLKLSLPDNNYEHLTCIVDIQTQKKNYYFLMDYADGFQDAILDSSAASINFEFTGKDEIKYVFQTNTSMALNF